MLFSYKYLSDHKMEKMQRFMDYIFKEIWCKAKDREYKLDLFDGEPDLKIIMPEIFKSACKDDLKSDHKSQGSAKYFYKTVQEIFLEFKSLSDDELLDYGNYFRVNNEVSNLCSGAGSCSPILYKNLNTTRPSLNNKIEAFFTNIYSSGFFDLVDVKKQVGATLKSYYKDFARENDNDVCPFCGLMPMDNEHDPTREAFDHYLPKSKYPFNSVNLKNLGPSCNKCNSGNKRDQDPLHNKQGVRRKAFDPFSNNHPSIEVNLRIDKLSLIEIDKVSITVETKCYPYQEEVDTWVELFRIHDRYIAKCRSKGGGKYWLNRILNERLNYGLTIDKMLEAELDSAKESPWTDTNFLKKAYLEACIDTDFFSIEAENLL